MLGRKRWSARWAIMAMGLAIWLIAPSGAIAAEDVVPEPVPEAPQEIIDSFANCPGPEAFDEGVFPLLCININVAGDLKLGHVESTIEEPLEISLALGLGGGLEPAIVAAEGDPPQPVPISGGILGIEALDPILELEPLGLLTLSATPNLGEVDTSATEAFDMLGFLSGAFGTLESQEAELMMGAPLAIKLNNTLFGNKCQIGTPESPIDINLTTGTSTPPEESGWPPISGEFGSGSGFVFQDTGYHYIETHGTKFVDNTFPTPGPQQCDLLLGDALDSPTGLFDPLIRAQTGLPASPGGSQAQLVVGTETTVHELIHEP